MTVKLKEIDQANSFTTLSSWRGLRDGGEIGLQNFKHQGTVADSAVDRTSKPK